MAQYLVLIYETEESYAALSPDEANAITAAYMAFGEKNAATIDGGNALQPTSTATTIRPDGSGGFTVTDGPFVETKEALGGYYLINADDLDAAIAVAKQVPARFGGVEVRPIMTFS
ncbi:MAG TPA: YciI family protein [Mycobacteriales bacterium]|nr:YciI family protein [Mycobacteriales bacterium]